MMQKEKAKRILKRIFIEAVKYIGITVILYCILLTYHTLSGMDGMKLQNYVHDNSLTGAESFFVSKSGLYTYYISDDPDTDSEIRVFEPVNRLLADIMRFPTRYKNYMSASTDEAVGSLYISASPYAEESDNTDEYLIYYSNNKVGIETVIYMIKDIDTGTVEEKTVDVTRHQPLKIIIPCVYNYDNFHYEVLDASFYDMEGNVVFRDKRV